MLTALDFYYGLYKDKLSTTSADAGAGWPGDAFAKNLASDVMEGNWLLPCLKTNAPTRPFACAELPAGPAGKGTPAFTVSYSIFKGTKVADAAWVLINYLTGPEGMAKWTEGGIAIPSRSDVPTPPGFEVIVAGGEYAKPGSGFISDYGGADGIQTVFQNAFVKQLDDKTYDAGPVVDATKTKIDQVLGS